MYRPSTEAELEATVQDILRDHARATDFINGGSVEGVRLADAGSARTVEILFRHPETGSCLYGWAYPRAWHVATGSTLPNASWVTDEFEHDVEAAGYGPPETCSPDAEGITWWVHPYGGRPASDWTFEDHVERSLRSYALDARPVSR
ncbi:MAG TPA: hypothetical protein VIY72_05205, partial [Acidimicrobiales bacterium]